MDWLEFLNNIGKDPLVILVGLLLLYAMRDLGAKLKKIDHIDVLVTQVQSLVSKVQDLINAHDKSRSEVDNKIKDIEIEMKELSNRVLKLETLQGE